MVVCVVVHSASLSVVRLFVNRNIYSYIAVYKVSDGSCYSVHKETLMCFFFLLSILVVGPLEIKNWPKSGRFEPWPSTCETLSLTEL